MQLRFLVTASLLHGALIVGVGLGVHAWVENPRPRPEIKMQPSVAEPALVEEARPEEPVTAEAVLADPEVVEPEWTPPAPSADARSEDKAEPERVLPEPVFSSPPLVKASPDLLARIRPAVVPAPAAEPAPAPPAMAVAHTDAVALDEHNRPPEYPAQAARRKIEGTVVLVVTVDVRGEVRKVELLQSAGLTRWHRLLDRAAIAAIVQWRYQPATENGAPVEVRIRQPVIFRYPR
jgi:protein TonB